MIIKHVVQGWGASGFDSPIVAAVSIVVLVVTVSSIVLGLVIATVMHIVSQGFNVLIARSHEQGGTNSYAHTALKGPSSYDPAEPS